MLTKSWAVTLAFLAAYMIGVAYTAVTGLEISPAQTELLNSLLLGFLGSGAIGGAVAIGKSKK